MDILQRQNLPRQIPIEETGRSYGFYAKIVFDVIAVLAALGFSYSYNAYLDGARGALAAVITAILFLTVSLLETFFTREWGRRFFILLLQTIALAVFFYDLPLMTISLAAGAMLAFSVWGELDARHDLKNSLEIKFLRIGKRTMGKVISGFIFLILIFYTPHFDPKTNFIPRNAFRVLYSGTTGVVHAVYSELNFGGSVRTLVEDLAKLQVNKAPSYQNVSPELREKAALEIAGGWLKGIKENINVKISGDEPAEEVLYSMIAVANKQWSEKLGDQITFGFVISLFVILRFMAPLFYWGVILLALVIYQILLAINVVHISSESRSQEVIEYS